MTPLHCLGCGRRFGRRARGLLIGASFVLCWACADDPKIHRKLFNCPLSHSPRTHGDGALVTAGRARQAVGGIAARPVIARAHAQN